MTTADTAPPPPGQPPESASWQRTTYRGGYALVLSSALTSGIGFLFWIVAARGYDVAEVGRNSALIYAVMFLAGVAHLNLLNVLVRFLPVAGRRSIRFVVSAYAVGGGLAALVGLIFAVASWYLAPDLAPDLHTPGPVLAFAACCAVWAIFVMQDGVLSAVRRSGVVALENGVFSVIKLGAVVLLAGLLPLHGIVVAWMASTGLMVLGTNAYLFGRALPRHVRESASDEQPIPRRSLLVYLGGDYLGTLCWLGCTQLLPVLVFGGVGPRLSAVFTMVWTIAYALYLVPAGLGQSMVANTSADLGRLAEASRGVLRRSYVLLLPGVAVLVIGAPFFLSILGPQYVAGAPALRLAALSALPNVITAVTVSTARVQRHMRTVIAVLAAVSVLVIGLAFTLLPIMGIAGVGMAMLLAQSAVAAVILVVRFRAGTGWITGRPEAAEPDPVVASPAFRAAADQASRELAADDRRTEFGDAERLAAWVEAPAERVRRVLRRTGATGLDRVVHVLDDELRGRYWPVRAAATPAGPTTAPSSAPGAAGAPVLADVGGALLAAEAEAGDRPLGAVLLDALRAPDSPTRVAWTSALRHAGLDGQRDEALLLLGWLHRIADELTESPRRAGNPLWLRQNVTGVLHAIAVREVPLGARTEEDIAHAGQPRDH